MDAVVAREGRTMHIASSVPQAAPFMVLVKSIAGFAILILCLAGAGAAVLKLQFGPAAQLAATAIGAVGGAVLVWYTRLSSAKK
jgi:hypothetical protein